MSSLATVGRATAGRAYRPRRPQSAQRLRVGEGRPQLHMVAPDGQELAAAIDSWLDGALDAPEPASQQAPETGPPWISS